MSNIKALVGSRPVVFIKSAAVGIDRGWDPTDVRHVLVNAGIENYVIEAQVPADIMGAVERLPDAIFWPACYTLCRDPVQSLVTKQLEELHVKYAGASSKSLGFSSKIAFKERAIGIPGVRTPAYQEIRQGNGAIFPLEISFPAMLKTEYSCNSEGVRRLDSKRDFYRSNIELLRKYGQRHYVEKWERSREYTVAVLPKTIKRDCVIAPIGMEIQNNSIYIDADVKSKSPLVRVFALDNNESSELMEMTSALVNGMSIDGHCRIDFIRNEVGMLFVIEANFQPFMSFQTHTRSYFPNAFILTKNLGFADQVYHLLEHAVFRTDE